MDSLTTPDGSSRAAAPLGSTLAVSLSIVGGLSMILFGPALALFEPTDLPEPFPDQNQSAENFLFVFALLVALPMGVFAGHRLVRRIEVSANANALPLLASLLASGLGAAVIGAKLSERLPWGGGATTLSVLVGAWWLASLALVAMVLRARPRSRWVGLSSNRWVLAWPLLVVAVLVPLSFTDLRDISAGVLVAGLAVGAAVWFAAGHGSMRLGQRLGWRAGLGFDLAAVILLFAAALNVVIFTPADPAAFLETPIVHFHQNFFLGPANHVLAGDAMLVESFSQYGVGSIYLLAGWFQLVPAGNGTLGVLDGALSAAGFVVVFVICRLCGASRTLALGALGVGVVALVYSLDYPLGALPQHGGIRFGLPLALLVAATVGERFADRRMVALVARGMGLVVVGISAIWALEAFIYTTATLTGLLAAGMMIEPPGRRRGWLVGRALAVLGAWAVAHLLLASLTLLFAGSLPAWGRYLDTLYAFLGGPVGDLTYDFSSFSAGFPVIAIYLASAVGIFVLWRGRRELVERESASLLALAGATSYGIALFSYFVNRSADHIVPYISLPVILILVLWLSLLRRTPSLASPTAWRAGLAISLGVGALVVSVAASSVDTRFRQSALGHLVPGGNSLAAAFERLWDPPPLAPQSPVGVRLLERYMPNERRSLVLTSADLGIEVLVRAGRANVLFLADPWEDSLVPEQHVGSVTDSIAALEAGQRMLVDEGGLEVFAELRRDSGRDPIEDPVGSVGIVPIGLANLQQLALQEIGRRFSLRPIAEKAGLSVVELVPRRQQVAGAATE